jgi:hypothetical protein
MLNYKHYKSQLQKWNRFIRGISAEFGKVYPNGFIDNIGWDEDKIIGEIFRKNNLSLEVQKFVYESSKPSIGKMTFADFQKKMTQFPIKDATGKKAKTNIWLNINNANTKQRTVNAIKRETLKLQKRVDFLRQARQRLSEGKDISVKYVEDLAKKTKDKAIREQARRFVREYKGYTQKRLESTYNALTQAIEDNIINIQQKRMVNEIVEKSISSPVKTTAQSTLNVMSNNLVIDDAKSKGAKYIRYRLNRAGGKYGADDPCDKHANANPEGKGKGVYKINSCPHPVTDTHVNCNCYLEIVVSK